MWHLNIFIEKQTKLFFHKSCGSRNTYTTTNTHKTREKQERLILDALRLKTYYPLLPFFFIVMLYLTQGVTVQTLARLKNELNQKWTLKSTSRKRKKKKAKLFNRHSLIQKPSYSMLVRIS